MFLHNDQDKRTATKGPRTTEILEDRRCKFGPP